MSLESEIKELTAAIKALPAEIAAALAGVTVAAPAEVVAEEPTEEKPKKAASGKKAAAKKDEPKAEEPAADEPDDGEAAKAAIIDFVRTYIGGMEHGSEKQMAEAAKVRAVFDSVGAAKAGDVPADKAVEVLEKLKKIEKGEAVEDGASSLI